MDLMASEGSAGEDPNAEKARFYEGDEDLLTAANAVKDTYTKGKIVEGTIGSADVWNNEVDRIKWFHTNYGTSVEEMEGAAAAQIAKAYDIPFLGIRVLSNNKVNGGQYNPDTATAWAMDSEMLCVISVDGKEFTVIDELAFEFPPKWAYNHVPVF